METSECTILWDDADGLVDLSGEMTSALVQSQVDIRTRAVIGQQFSQHHVARVQYNVTLQRMVDAEDVGGSLQGDAGVGNLAILHPNDQGLMMHGAWVALPRRAQRNGFQVYDVPIVQAVGSGEFGKLWRIADSDEVVSSGSGTVVAVTPGIQVFVALTSVQQNTQIERDAGAAGSRRLNAGSRTIYSLPPFNSEDSAEIHVSAGAEGWVLQCEEAEA